jgi:hypothetical protein
MAKHYAKVSFWVDLPQAQTEDEAKHHLNELIDKLGAVETDPTYWDDVEWEIYEAENE